MITTGQKYINQTGERTLVVDLVDDGYVEYTVTRRHPDGKVTVVQPDQITVGWFELVLRQGGYTGL